jgi:hypothetical protein
MAPAQRDFAEARSTAAPVREFLGQCAHADQAQACAQPMILALIRCAPTQSTVALSVLSEYYTPNSSEPTRPNREGIENGARCRHRRSGPRGEGKGQTRSVMGQHEVEHVVVHGASVVGVLPYKSRSPTKTNRRHMRNDPYGHSSMLGYRIPEFYPEKSASYFDRPNGCAVRLRRLLNAAALVGGHSECGVRLMGIDRDHRGRRAKKKPPDRQPGRLFSLSCGNGPRVARAVVSGKAWSDAGS